MRLSLTAASLIIATIPVIADAQNVWTLDSCINHAVSHNLTVKNREISVATSELEVTSAKDAFLPSVSAGVSQTFNFGRGLTSENTYANRNTSNFGWNAGLQLPLFQGMRRVRTLDYARTNLRMTLEQLESAKDDITLNVIAQYLQVLYCTEIHNVAVEQLRLSNIELQRRRELLEAGKIAELDLTQAESQVAQDELSVVTALNDRSIALLDLAQLLELPSSESFEVAELPDSPTAPIPYASDVYNAAININHSIAASRLGVESAAKAVSVAKSGYLPSLSFTAGVGSSYYKVSGFDNEGFGPQMRHNLSKSLGFSLNIPIFDAFSTRNSVRRAQVQQLSARLQLKDTENRLYKAIAQAHAQATAAEKRMEAAAVATRSTQTALDAMREKYNYGKANATEFEQARTEYLRAVSTAVQAKYESLLRRRILSFYASGR